MERDRPDDARKKDLAAVDRSPTRCPYCHDSIAPDDLDQAVVCGQCLARHHRDCWDTRCGACSSTVALGRLDVGVGVGVDPGDPSAPYERVKRGLNLAFLGCFVGCIVVSFVVGVVFGPQDLGPPDAPPPPSMYPMLIGAFLTALIALPMIAVNSYDAFVRRARDPATPVLAPVLALAGVVTGGFSALGYWARWGWQPLPRAKPKARPDAPPKGK